MTDDETYEEPVVIEFCAKKYNGKQSFCGWGQNQGDLEHEHRKLLKIDNYTGFETIELQIQELQQQLLEQLIKDKGVSSIGVQIIHLKEQKKNIDLDKVVKDNSRSRMDEMLEFPDQNEHDELEFDKVLVRSLVEQVIIYDDHII